MPKVLVTGAGGYIGSVLCQVLLDEGHAVVALDRFFFGDTLAEHDGLTRLTRDIRDVGPGDFEGVDAVFDLAALSNDPTGDLDPALTRAINHEGRVRVATAAKEAGVGRYILSSSCSIYGTGARRNLREDAPIQPLTVYAKSNHAAEQDTRALADDDFVVTALRNGTVFGVSPRMRFDLVINIMTLHAFERGRILVTGGGRQWRPLVHVADVAQAFLATLAAPPEQVQREVFNVGCGNFRVRTVASIVREVLPIPVTVEVAPDDADKRDYSVSFDKLETHVGFRAERSVEEGIREVYDALKFGDVEASPRTSTVGWYRRLLEAKALVDALVIDGRLL
ncbi:MAG: SDR family oxidoreductase [Myxococcota bacterium]